MSGSDYLPKNDGKLLDWMIQFLNFLSTAMERFGFPSEVFNRLKTLLNDFEHKLEVAESPESCTPTNIRRKNTAKATLKSTIRQTVKEYLAYNHNVTDDDRVGLGIPIHKKTHTPAPVADAAPDFDIDSGTVYRLIIYFFESGGSHRKAKPAGQHGAEIAWEISDTPIIEVSKLTHSSFDTRTPCILEFEGNQRGKTLYLALRWENTRGLKGPWSPIRSEIIP
jgi:hypothetical protein